MIDVLQLIEISKQVGLPTPGPDEMVKRYRQSLRSRVQQLRKALGPLNLRASMYLVGEDTYQLFLQLQSIENRLTKMTAKTEVK